MSESIFFLLKLYDILYTANKYHFYTHFHFKKIWKSTILIYGDLFRK